MSPGGRRASPGGLRVELPNASSPRRDHAEETPNGSVVSPPGADTPDAPLNSTMGGVQYREMIIHREPSALSTGSPGRSPSRLHTGDVQATEMMVLTLIVPGIESGKDVELQVSRRQIKLTIINASLEVPVGLRERQVIPLSRPVIAETMVAKFSKIKRKLTVTVLVDPNPTMSSASLPSSSPYDTPAPTPSMLQSASGAPGLSSPIAMAPLASPASSMHARRARTSLEASGASSSAASLMQVTPTRSPRRL